MTEKMDIEIHDKKIDVKKIMKKVRENIRKRREEQRAVDVEELERKSKSQHPTHDLQQDLEFINANWDTENKTYRIFSHRKILGPALITGRELVHGEIRRYVDPVFWKQKEFNASTTRILNYLSKEIQKLERQIRIVSRNSKGKKK
jgi:hypothetical protein